MRPSIGYIAPPVTRKASSLIVRIAPDALPVPLMTQFESAGRSIAESVLNV